MLVLENEFSFVYFTPTRAKWWSYLFGAQRPSVTELRRGLVGHEVASLSGCLRCIRLRVWPILHFYFYFLSFVIGYVLLCCVAFSVKPQAGLRLSMIRGYLGLRGTGTEGGMTIMKDEADRQRDRQGQGFLECGGGVRLFSSSFFSLVRCASFADTRAPERGGRVGRVLKKNGL